MKRFFQYLIIFLLTAFFGFISCKKEKPSFQIINTPPPPPPPPATPPAITNVQLTEFGKLSKGRYHLLAATAGNKMLFVGGRYFVPNAWFDSTDNNWWNAEYTSTRVDIYDTSTHTWSIAELEGSQYDSWSKVATVDNKIFLADGYRYDSQDSGRIDIYDASTNSWSNIHLPLKRKDIAVAALGTKVFFAGGGGSNIVGPSNRVDIYDVSTNLWSTATLSEPRVFISGTSFGNKIFFAGGHPLTTRIDIYNGTTQSWSTAELSSVKYLIKTATAGNRLLFDGGDGNSSSVDIYNDSTQSWSSIIVNSPGPFHFKPAASLGNDAFSFMYSSQVNIYNSERNTWSIATITPYNPYGHKASITVGNQIYLAGGFDGNTNSEKVWRVQF